MLDTLDAGYSGCWILWMLDTLDAGYSGCWILWKPKMLDAGEYWILEILDAGDSGCWRQWMLRMPGVGAGDACCFIIVCFYVTLKRSKLHFFGNHRGLGVCPSGLGFFRFGFGGGLVTS